MWGSQKESVWIRKKKIYEGRQKRNGESKERVGS